MRKILSVICLVLVIQLAACLHLGTTDHRINTRRTGQNAPKLPHSVFPVILGMDLVASLFLMEKLCSKSIKISLFSKEVSKRKIKQDLHRIRSRRSLSITHSFDLLRSSLLNSIKTGYVAFGENTDKNIKKELEDRGGLNDIG
jgi:hypothetical protein